MSVLFFFIPSYLGRMESCLYLAYRLIYKVGARERYLGWFSRFKKLQENDYVPIGGRSKDTVNFLISDI